MDTQAKRDIDTQVIRVLARTARALRRVAYSDPFNCSSLANFLRLVERGDMAAIVAWQKEAKKK